MRTVRGELFSHKNERAKNMTKNFSHLDKAAIDTRATQLNPNNGKYWKSRGIEKYPLFSQKQVKPRHSQSRTITENGNSKRK